MSSVDNRVVKMAFDNEEFEKKAGTTLGTLEKLKNSLNFSGAAKGMGEIAKAAASVEFSALSDGVQALQDRFSVMGEFAHNTFMNILNTAIDTGKQIAEKLVITPAKEGFAEYELQMNSVQTIMASTGESVDTINKYLDELNTYADKTIYSFSDMTQNIGKFTNAGVSLDDSVKAIQGISNVAAVSGANTQEASRAMYNFAQALSAGYVKLIDWKSIENANMATVEFKQTLIETGLAMGTLVKEGDMYRSTTTNANGAVSELFDATTGFNESLQAQWMSTEVLKESLKGYAVDIRSMTDEQKAAYEEQLRGVGYTEDQIAAIEELGQKAFDAAQDVKTFSQLIDTLFNETIASGWTKSWQIVIGDFEEAKQLWTGVSKTLGDIIDKNAETRNAMLQAWSDAGGRTALIDSFKNAFDALVSIMTPLKEAWNEVFPALKAEDLVKYTNNLKAFTEGLKLNEEESNNVHNVAKQMFDTFKNGFEGIINVGKTVRDVLKAIGKGIQDAFKIEQIQPFTNLTTKFKEFTEALRPSEKALEAIQHVVAGVSSVLSAFAGIAANAGAALFNAFGGRLNEFKQNGDGFLDQIIQIGDKLKELGDKLSSTINIDSFSGFDSITKALSNFFGVIHDSINLPDLLKNMMDYLLGIDFSGILNTINGAAQGSSNAMELIHNAISNFMSGNLLGGLIEKIKEFVGGIDWKAISGIFSHIESFVATKSLFMLAKSAKNLPKTLGGLIDKVKDVSNTPVGAVTNLLNGVKDCLESWQKNLKALLLIEIGAGLLAIAKAVKTVGEVDPSRVVSSLELLGGGLAEFAIMLKVLKKMDISEVANLWGLAQVMEQLGNLLKKLSEIAPERLRPTVIALGAVLLELAVALKIMKGTDVKADEIAKKALVLMTLSKSVSMLADVMKKIAVLEPDQIMKGMLGVVGLMAALVAAVNLLPKDKAISGATAMIAMAEAVKILGKVVAELGKLSLKELVKGLGSVALLLCGLVLALNNLPDSGKLLSSGAAMILIGTAIKSLTGSLKELAAIDTFGLVKALGAFAIMLGGLVIALNNLPDSGKLLSSGVAMILIGVAIGSLTGSLERLAAIDTFGLVRALGAFAIMLGGLVIALNNLPDSGKLLSSGAAMILIGIAISSLTGSLERLSAIDTFGLVKALGAFVIMLDGLVIALNNLPDSGKLLSSGVAMILIGVAIGSLTDSLARIANIELGSLAKAIIGMGAALLILSTAAKSFNSSMAGAAAMVIVATAIALLAPALLMLSNIEIGGLAIALGAVAGVMAIFAIAANGLAPSVGVLLAFGAAVALAGIGLFALSAALGAVANIVEQSGTQISAAFSIILQAFIDNIPLVVQLVTTLAVSLLESLGAIVPAIIELGLTIIVSFLQSIAEHIGEIVEAGVSIVVNFILGVAEKMPDIVDAALKLIIGFIDGLATAIDNNHNALFDAVGHLITSIVKAIVDGITNIGKSAGDLITGPGGFLDGLKNFAKDVFNAGKNLVQGFIDGIGSLGESLWNSACDIANQAIGAITQTTQEHSPSKVTTKMGEYFTQGFINGISNLSSGAASEAAAVAYGAMSALESGLDSADTKFTPTYSYTPVIDASEIQNGVSGVIGMMDSIPSTYGITADLTNQNRMKSQMMELMSSGQDFSEIVGSIGQLSREMAGYTDAVGKMQMVLDTGTLVGQLTPGIDMGLGRSAVLSRRGV